MNIVVNKEIIKRQVEIVRNFLKEGHQDISQSSAYNLISKMYGARDWNTLKAYLDKQLKIETL